MSMLLLQIEVEWANRTSIHLVGLAFMAVLAFGALVVPRRLAPFTLLALACFIPAGQRWVVLTLDFSFLRLMILVGWLRVLVWREATNSRSHALDWMMLAWSVTSLTAFILRRGTSEAMIFKLGTTFDALGLYFLFRVLVRDWIDLDRVAAALAFLAVPVGLAFVIERSTGRNLFSVFGGVPEVTEARLGQLRCQGAFGHPILAGCFWAAALPLVVARWWTVSKGRLGVAISVLCTLMIIAFTASSTPFLAVLIAGVGGASFFLRRHMAAVRLATVLGLVGLQAVKTAPVWQLLTRINVVGGSTGWHRFYLIDETIRRFGEWWLLGTVSTAHWGIGLTDVTNQYVAEAIQGGLAGLLLFLGLIVLGFRAAGHAWRSAWPERGPVALAWALGVSLLTQCTAFIGVSSFDQSGILWFLVLACLASTSTFSRGAASPNSEANRPRGSPATADAVQENRA